MIVQRQGLPVESDQPTRTWLDAMRSAATRLPLWSGSGNAGSNTADDHVAVSAMALAQLPVDPTMLDVVARADSAGLTHGFINACVAAGVRFSVGHDLTEPVRTACLNIPKRAWHPALTADGSGYRDGAEITNMIDLSLWPAGLAIESVRSTTS